MAHYYSGVHEDEVLPGVANSHPGLPGYFVGLPRDSAVERLEHLVRRFPFPMEIG